MIKFIALVLLIAVLQEKRAQCSPTINEDSEYRGGKDIVEGDIKLTPTQAAIFKISGWNALVKSEAWRPDNNGLWPRFIPYKIDNIDRQERDALDKSIKEIQKFTCLRFHRRTNENDYIRFFKDSDKCNSQIGKQGGSQDVSLGTGCNFDIPAHEIMHALGRFHEQSRPDRNRFVTIEYSNIPNDETRNNFLRIIDADTQTIPYDYMSLMHYERDAFSSNRKDTVVPTKTFGVRIGQRDRLTIYDALHINIEYCPEKVVRLVGGKGPHEGRVEVFWNGQWGTVCGRNFPKNSGKVICKYLGFPNVRGVFKKENVRRFGQGYGPIWFANMRCAGNEQTPYHCPMVKHRGRNGCRHANDVALVCGKNIRLRNTVIKRRGGRKNKRRIVQGRVDAYVNGKWGTVCSDGFGRAEAKVICRQLGYKGFTRFGRPIPRFRWNQRTAPIMTQLRCTGEEEQLIHCRRNFDNPRRCGGRRRNQPAAIRCVK